MVLRRLPVPVLAAVVLAGCAGQGEAPGAPAPSSSAALPSVLPSPSPTRPTSFMPLDPHGVPTSPAIRKLTGSVVAGVEPGCLLLRTDSGDYLLLISGNRDAAAVGARVVATGTVAEGMVTTCQQGTPFVVAEISAA